MAFVSRGYFLVVNFQDMAGDKTQKIYEMTATDDATAATDTATVLAAIAGVSDLEIESYFYYNRQVEDTISLPATAQHENRARLTFRLDAAGDKRATHDIPGPAQAIFVASTGPNANVVDTGDAAVITYRTLFQGNELLISDGEDVDVLLSGKRVHVKSNKG